MRFIWRSDKEAPANGPGEGSGACNRAQQYESGLWIESKAAPGVRFAIQRVSLGRRMEFSRRVRELSRKAEFLEAGTQIDEKIEANILAQEIDVMYLQWGLMSIEGLFIDGEAATTGLLLERGPENLAREIIGAIKEQCGLSEPERKN